MVVAKSAERLPPMPEVRGSNLVTGKKYREIVLTLYWWKDENREKEPGNEPLKTNLT